jgi:hypothetical protein
MMFEKITRTTGYTLEGTLPPVGNALNGLVEWCTRPEPTARITPEAALKAIAAM